MNKMAKRLIAVILTVCSVLSVMVPAAWADTEENGTLKYSFGYAGCSVNGETITAGSSGYQILKDGTDNLNSDGSVKYKGLTVNTKTDFKDWSYLYQSVTSTIQVKSNVTIVTFSKSTAGHFVAMQIAVPKEGGTYELSFAMDINADNGGFTNVYIVDAAEFECPESTKSNGTEAGKFITALIEAGEVINASNDIVLNSVTGSSTQNVGIVTFPAVEAEEEYVKYVLLFQGRDELPESSTREDNMRYLRLKTLTMTPVVATVGDEAYTDAASAETAIAATDANTAVKITGDLQLSSALTTNAAITVADGAVLDLNGNNLSAEAVTCNGTGIVKDSQNGTGLITVNSGAVLKADSTQLALYDSREGAEGYRVYNASVATYKPTFKNGTDTAEGVKFLFTLNFTNTEAYGAIATGESGLAVKGTWSVNEQELSFPGDKVKEWASAQYTAQEGQTYVLYVNVTGMENVDSLTITPKVGALSAAAITYPAQ